MYLRSLMLGGVSRLPLFAPDGVVGGAGGGTVDPNAGAGAGGAAGGAGGAGASGAGGDGSTAGAGGAGAGSAGAVATVAADTGTAAKPGDTTLAGGGVDPKVEAGAAAVSPGAFPADWREQLAGDDKKLLADLQKYNDPKAMYGSLRELQGKISKGEIKTAGAPFPKEGTPEQQAEWRKAQSLPETAEGYIEKLALPDGVVVGEADKPLVASFAKTAFAEGATQAEVNRAVNWFYSQQAEAQAAQGVADGESKTGAMQELMTDWGTVDYKKNMNAMGSFLAAAPEDLRNDLLSARTADGRMLGNTAGFIKWASSMGRELNPAASLVAPGTDSVAAVSSEIKTIEETYRKAVSGDAEARRAYYGNDGKPGLEVRYRELVDAQQKMAARGGRAA